MMMLCMGVALLVVALTWLAPMMRGLGSLRDRFWALVVLVVLTLLAIGMIREGLQGLGVPT